MTRIRFVTEAAVVIAYALVMGGVVCQIALRGWFDLKAEYRRLRDRVKESAE